MLDNSRIKDLRTNVEISNTQKVLDGDLAAVIQAYVDADSAAKLAAA